MIRELAAVALVLALSGCVVGTQKEGRPIDTASVLKLKPGVSTKQEVLDLFGPPTATTRALAGQGVVAALGAKANAQDPVAPEDVYTYEYREDNEKFFSAVLIYTWFQRVRLADTLMVVFGPKDVVKYVAFSKQTDASPADDNGK